MFRVQDLGLCLGLSLQVHSRIELLVHPRSLARLVQVDVASGSRT